MSLRFNFMHPKKDKHITWKKEKGAHKKQVLPGILFRNIFTKL